ncbi:MAG: low molecular weight phosphotyrosine protein phosphatase [Curvibacter lanceolatus]|uniref:low molecular weight protein-tyrosine-phosphatase n=1 Tax=Curvibacter lanceolatus TaxID=86182 RepID=UPI0005B7E6BE|nr:low molecular weight protein-tyrosine-phosphatase [Curvibacter lanceolatus]MBV5295055.1 low molecular weight phosphotyrosine protein phosphatase [Curvibacter lanceolatus]
MPSQNHPLSLLFVCMGNICRSPTAESVMRHKVQALGLASQVQVDSAGTHAYHVGSAPDPRSQAHAARRGYDMAGQRARQVAPADFARHDLILAMDRANLARLRQACPAQHQAKLHLLTEYGPQQGRVEVPDPYEGGAAGFEQVLDLIEEACDGLLAQLTPPAPPPA